MPLGRWCAAGLGTDRPPPVPAASPQHSSRPLRGHGPGPYDCSPMVRLQLLGALGLTGDDGRDVRGLLAQPKRFALLCYLALAEPRAFQRRDGLVALFWPEADGETAR